jgi:apolipoprotein N-acyltransferase
MTARAVAYPVFWRVAAAILIAISRGSCLVLVALLLFLDAWLGIGLGLDNPLRLLRAFSLFCLLPGIAAWLVKRALAVTVGIENRVLVLERRRQRVEIPCDVIDRVVPWAVPLPGGGLWLRLRSGRRFRYGLQVGDPIALIEALAVAGRAESLRAATRQPAAIYVRSAPGASRRWYQPLLKFVVFGLVPTLPLFRLHQWIAYGGTFGEYYMYGLKAYLLAFAIYWANFSVHLVLYAAVLRAFAEPIVLGTAYAAPAAVPRVRRLVETANRFLYYGGVPLFLIGLFWSS